MAYVDKELVCRDCGTTFVFTAGEQEFFASRGFTHDPARCPVCRAARKQARRTDTERAGDSNPPSGRPKYQIVCAACGAIAEVPFQPRGGRPVYCETCFRERQRARREERV